MGRNRTFFSLVWQLPLAAGVVALLFAASVFSPSPPSGEAGVLVMGVDSISDGSNTASSLGTIDECREVSVGQSFDVDVYIQNASDLRGIDFRFGYNPALLTVVSANANFLISGFGEPPIEESPGVYFVGQGSSTAQAGNGVLTRFTLQANAAGLSEASIKTTPLPPYLSTTDGAFSHTSPILNARIAIGQSCSGAPTLPPTPTPPPTLPPTPSATPLPTNTSSPTPITTGSGSPTPTPTFTPVPGSIPWGDIDCRQGVTIDDAVQIAQIKAGLTVSTGTPCPEPGDEVFGAQVDVNWGDFNCNGQFGADDILAIIRYLLGLAIGAPGGCPSIATNYVSFP